MTTIRVQADKPGAKIDPAMWGIFFEDINFGADGGLYPELVKNRSFEFGQPLMGWKVIRNSGAEGRVFILRDGKRPRNPRYARIRVEDQGGGFVLSNEGFRGMGIREGADYRFSIEARSARGGISAMRVEVAGQDGRILAEARVEGFSPEWQAYSCEMKSNGTDDQAKMNLWIEGTGELDIDMVSLFPMDTWKGRENGLRPDLVRLLADLKPGFLRFPGGCIVEGFDLSQRYQWKNTVGPLNERVCTINRWNFEFKHKPAPDYYQSYGLGFYEFFLLAEDIGAKPMPIINIGMACQFNTGELAPLDQLAPYIQDALDLIEFANGPADSPWGKVRCRMGHAAPFGMKMIGIGNEQWGPQYIERYKEFASAIKAKHQDMQLIAATGSDATIFPDGTAEVAYLWSEWRKLKPDIVDEHFYRAPEWFLQNTGWYDAYDRSGPKVFVGEYASLSEALTSPENRNSLKCALYEAAFMTGLERNADLVVMSCYAPLFGHEQAWQWRPDLIWFDNLNAYGSANYYVQKAFSLNRGSHVLRTEVEGAPGPDARTKSFHVSASFDESTGEAIVKAVNAAGAPLEAALELKGAARIGRQAKVVLLTSGKLTDENSLQEPKKIYPKETAFPVSGVRFMFEFKPYSLTVIRVPIR
jgi:alpha-N-arabinofuranosidase